MNQRNILNFFRVTTPTPVSKRDNTELKVTPKKPQLPPKAKKSHVNLVDPSPVITSEVFVLDDSDQDHTPLKPIDSSPTPQTPSEPIPFPPLEDSTQETPPQIPISSAESSPQGHLEIETLPLSGNESQDEIQSMQHVVVVDATLPTPPVNEVELVSGSLVCLDARTDSEPLVQSVVASDDSTSVVPGKRIRKQTQKYSEDPPPAASPTHPSLPTLCPEVVERLELCKQKADSIIESLRSDHW